MNSYKGLICNFRMGIDNSFEVSNGLNACIYGNKIRFYIAYNVQCTAYYTLILSFYFLSTVAI